MKHLLTLPVAVVLLTGCSPSTSELTPQQAAVTAYLKKTLDDPASYQPAYWSVPEKRTIGDRNREAHTLAGMRYSVDSMKVSSDSISNIKTLDSYKTLTFSGVQNYKKRYVRIYDSMHAIHLRSRDSARTALSGIGSLADTTPSGVLITHAFRAKNKMGALVLDSARFEVDANGKVSVWSRLKD